MKDKLIYGFLEFSGIVLFCIGFLFVVVLVIVGIISFVFWSNPFPFIFQEVSPVLVLRGCIGVGFLIGLVVWISFRN